MHFAWEGNQRKKQSQETCLNEATVHFSGDWEMEAGFLTFPFLAISIGGGFFYCLMMAMNRKQIVERGIHSNVFSGRF